MPVLGNAAPKPTEFGKLYFDDKDIEYLKNTSRDVTENHHNASVLFFQIDWSKSKRNFYGELIHKKFMNNKGIELKCMFKLKQGDEQIQQGLPNKIMKLTVSCYVDTLKELSIEPAIGDYFSIGQRFYMIYDRTLKDAGPGNVLGNRERMRIDYLCIQEDDENVQNNPFGDNLGTEAQIRSSNGDITK